VPFLDPAWRLCARAAGIAGATGLVTGAHGFRKLTLVQISAHLAGKDMSDACIG